MNLDPTVSPWIGIFASTGVCLWMAVIGAPLSKAVFGDRPRLVWPFYAPALGIVVVLLTTNLSAYVIPGAPSAWFGLLAPSALAALVAWRTDQIRLPSRRTALASMVFLSVSTGAYLFALASRTQQYSGDAFFHYPLTLRLARGVFPPVTPYGPDAGIGYHYGPDLLAASVVNTAAVPAWTATVVLVSFLAIALALAGVGFTRDKCASLPLSIGVGAVLGLFPFFWPLRVGLPPYVAVTGQAEGVARFIEGLAPPDAILLFEWLQKPQYTLALAIVILTAASLDGRVGSRVSAVLVVVAGVSALASASVMVFSGAALGVIGLVRLVWLRGRNQFTLAAALLAGGLLAALAGGPASDALFGRGGSASMVRVAFEPNWTRLTPFEVQGPALIGIGIVPLIAVGSIAAYRRRSWGLCYLTAAGFFGIVEYTFLQSPIPANEGRILPLATVVAAFAALLGVATLSQDLRGRWRIAATLVVMLLAVFPTVVPQATAVTRLASQGFNVGQPVTDGPGYPLVEQTTFRQEQFRKDLGENWDFYSWLSRSLTNDARLLTPHPASSAGVAGVATPISGVGIQVLSPRVTPVYEDALRFLHRDDLADMRITHLHVTDAWQSALAPEAQRLLEDPDHFRLLAELRSISGRRHRLFSVAPGAGTVEVDPSSFRALRQSVPSKQPFVILDGLTVFQRHMLLYTLVDHPDLRSPPTEFGRTSRFPRVLPAHEVPDVATVALPERIEPLMLGLTSDDAIWTGYGMGVYDLTSAWSPVWRPGIQLPSPTEHFQTLCQVSTDGQLNLRLLGEPGDEVLFGTTDTRLTGKPQVYDITVGSCRTVRLATEPSVSPFAQVRLLVHDSSARRAQSDSALGFDSGNNGNEIIINIWYRNPKQVSIAASTEFRLYEIGPIGITPRYPSPRSSVRWWQSAITLSAHTQMTRVVFDPEGLQINEEKGGGVATDTKLGLTYLLTINIAVVGTQSGLAEIQQQIPLVRFEAGGGVDSWEAFSGIVSVRRPEETSGLAREYSSKIGYEIDRTPGLRARAVSS